MPIVRLLNEVREPDGHGPGNGQFALQRLLRLHAPDWLRIGGELQPGEIPWVWSWQNARLAARRALDGEPFSCGPNVLFSDSRRPRANTCEDLICDAESCQMLFTESAWYADLIRSQLGPLNKAPVVTWPYPIWPIPDGPAKIEHDVLLYVKGPQHCPLLSRLVRSWPRTEILLYGSYRREELWHLAARSRVCVYLSADDRGPLALAEILLCGCPTVGVARGAPWIDPGANGHIVDGFGPPGGLAGIRSAVAACEGLDRQAIRQQALARFDGRATLEILLGALATIADAP